MALRGQVVDFVRLYLLHNADQIGGVGQIAIVQNEAAIGRMRVLVQMVNAAGIEAGRAAFDAMDFVAAFEQEFGQIRAILAGHAGDQGYFLGHVLLVLLHGLRGNTVA